MRIRKLIAGLPLSLQKNTAPPDRALQITDIVTEAHEASAQTLFVCVHTHLRNYHYDARAAYHNGCRVFVAERGLVLPPDATVLVTESTKTVLGILAARCHRYPAKHVKVIGITGTHGKTSVALLLAALLGLKDKRVGTITTDGIAYGDREIPATATAPNAADLQRTLHQMRDAGVCYVIVEFTAYMLKHGAALGMRFAATLLTDLMPHHLNEHTHRTFEDYRHAKEQLFLQKSALSVLPQAITDITTSTARVIRTGNEQYGIRNVCRKVKNGINGIEFTAIFRGKELVCYQPVPAMFAASNAFDAMLLADAFGIAPSRAAAALENLRVPCRMECISHREDKLIFLDSAYTGEALARVLTELRAITKGRLSVLLGSVGGRAKDRRALLGKTAVEMADFTYFTADDPDSEQVDGIIEDMLIDVPQTPFYTIIKDRKATIRTAVLEEKRGDVLLILGKAEQTQLTKDGKLPFSDRSIVSDAAEAHQYASACFFVDFSRHATTKDANICLSKPSSDYSLLPSRKGVGHISPAAENFCVFRRPLPCKVALDCGKVQQNSL